MKDTTESDYTEICCPKCGTIHWVPNSLLDIMQMKKNDYDKINAYCPYGHNYHLTPDKISEDGIMPPPSPRPLKKPWRFWDKKERQLDDNVVKFKRE